VAVGRLPQRDIPSSQWGRWLQCLTKPSVEKTTSGFSAAFSKLFEILRNCRCCCSSGRSAASAFRGDLITSFFQTIANVISQRYTQRRMRPASCTCVQVRWNMPPNGGCCMRGTFSTSSMMKDPLYQPTWILILFSSCLPRQTAFSLNLSKSRLLDHIVDDPCIVGMRFVFAQAWKSSSVFFFRVFTALNIVARNRSVGNRQETRKHLPPKVFSDLNRLWVRPYPKERWPIVSGSLTWLDQHRYFYR